MKTLSKKVRAAADARRAAAERVRVPAQEPRLYVVARKVDGHPDLIYGSLARTRSGAWTLAAYAYTGTHGTASMLKTLRKAGYRAVQAHVEVTL